MHGVIFLISACFDFVVSLGEWEKWERSFYRNKEIAQIFVNAPGHFDRFFSDS